VNASPSVNQIEFLRNQSVNYVLIGFSIIGLVNYAFVLINTFIYGFVTPIDFIIQTTATFTLVMVTLLRKNFSSRIKINILAIIIVLVTATTFYSVGLFSNAKIYIVIFPALVALLFSLRRGLIVLITLLLTFLAAAYLYSSGIWEYRFDPLRYGTLGTNWIIGIMVVIYSAGGMLWVGFQFAGSLKDIYTRLQKQNQQLRESEEKYHVLFESSNDGIFILNNGRIIECNNRTLELFGGIKDEIIGKTPAELSPVYQPDGESSEIKAQRIRAKVSNNEPAVFDWLYKKLTGELFFASVSLNVADFGNPGMVQAVIRDITAEKLIEQELKKHEQKLQVLVNEKSKELMSVNSSLKTYNEELSAINEEILTQNDALKDAVVQLKSLQKQLLHSEKMASIGVLTSGIAHEINNPINFINSGVFGIEQEMESIALFFSEIKQFAMDYPTHKLAIQLKEIIEDDNLEQSFKNLPIINQSIYSGVTRTTKIVRSLRTFARGDTDIRQQVSLKEIIESALTILHNRYSGSVKINTNYIPDDSVDCFPGRLVQLFLNVLHAIILFVKQPSEIAINTYFNNTGDKINTSILFFQTDQPASLSILYVGGPFSSVNPEIGRGIIDGIINEHNGEISVVSHDDSTTGFIITLPEN